MSGPTKFRLPYAPNNHLRVVENDSAAPDKVNAVCRGVAYPLAQWRAWLGRSSADCEGLMGGYRLDCERGEVLPVNEDENRAWCWDSHGMSAPTIADNDFQLLASSVDGLSVEQGVDCALLSITPRFAVRYKTRAFPARLGEIRLVSASRFVTDSSGEQYSLLDTQAASMPVLYQECRDDDAVIRQATDWQALGAEQDYCFDYRIHQVLRSDLLGVKVSSITVLEHYHSYFMQRAIAFDAGQTQWVPACAPVRWGWSLRVEPEADDWVVTRRKMIPPVVGSDGWVMPEWRGTTNDYLTVI